jgi:hypothetical protein
MANNPPVAAKDFFRGTGGGLRTNVEAYVNKITWSGDIFDVSPVGSGVQVTVNFQTADLVNSRAKTRSYQYTSGILNIPDSELLTLSDDDLEDREPLSIGHKCHTRDTFAMLDIVDRDVNGNSQMQFSKAPASSEPVFTNGGFEDTGSKQTTVDYGGWLVYSSDSATALPGWKVGGAVRVIRSKTEAWGSVPAVEGINFVCLHHVVGGTIMQEISNLLPRAEYTISWWERDRPGYVAKTLKVQIDDNVVSPTHTVPDDWTYKEAYFVATAETMMVSFIDQGATADGSVFLDGIAVTSGRGRNGLLHDVWSWDSLNQMSFSSDSTFCDETPTPAIRAAVTEKPQCLGCASSASNPGDCWSACGSERGFCSACDSTGGIRGACCKRGDAGDPEECKMVPDEAFRFSGYHECVLTNQKEDTIRSGEAFVPEVFFEGVYYPVCGHYFWDSNNGANAICQAAGFPSGQMQTSGRTGIRFSKPAITVGDCRPGESWDGCTAGGNGLKLNGNDPKCAAGEDIGVEIVCGGIFDSSKVDVRVYREAETSVLVHKGHCASGWIADHNTLQSSLAACLRQCKEHPNCGYFAYAPVNRKNPSSATNCALYTTAGGCLDDNNHDEYSAYKLSEPGRNIQAVFWVKPAQAVSDGKACTLVKDATSFDSSYVKQPGWNSGGRCTKHHEWGGRGAIGMTYDECAQMCLEASDCEQFQFHGEDSSCRFFNRLRTTSESYDATMSCGTKVLSHKSYDYQFKGYAVSRYVKFSFGQHSRKYSSSGSAISRVWACERSEASSSQVGLDVDWSWTVDREGPGKTCGNDDPANYALTVTRNGEPSPGSQANFWEAEDLSFDDCSIMCVEAPDCVQFRYAEYDQSCWFYRASLPVTRTAPPRCPTESEILAVKEGPLRARRFPRDPVDCPCNTEVLREYGGCFDRYYPDGKLSCGNKVQFKGSCGRTLLSAEGKVWVLPAGSKSFPDVDLSTDKTTTWYGHGKKFNMGEKFEMTFTVTSENSTPLEFGYAGSGGWGLFTVPAGVKKETMQVVVEAKFTGKTRFEGRLPSGTPPSDGIVTFENVRFRSLSIGGDGACT